MIDDATAFCPPSSVLCRPLQQILLRYGGSEPVIVFDEFVDEFMQPVLENLLDPTVLQSPADGPRLALRRSLAAVGFGDAIEVLHQVLIAACERPRHFVPQYEQIGHKPRLDVLAIDPV